MPKKGECYESKHFERTIKSQFMIYSDYSNKYQKYVACSYNYKLVCVDDNFCKPFKPYLGKNAVYNFISSMIEENKYGSDVMKKHTSKAWPKKMMKIWELY